jgi:hypothetical protein
MRALPSHQFHGKPCRVCGETLRYRTVKPCGKCVACVKTQGQRGRRGLPEPWRVDLSVNAETSQPTYTGKPCLRCGSAIKFTKRKGTCVRCHKQWRRDREVYSPKYSSSLFRNCRITPEMYLQMCEDQDWRCAICKEVPRKLVGDHCHSSGKFRGLICAHCNSGLGFFKDSPDRMNAAIEYLRQ